jgi:hypothetical protein
MYAYDPAADSERYRRRVITDARLRRFYTGGLIALAAGLDDEFTRPDGPPGGWHVFVSCRKPGRLDPNRPKPEPVCPACGSADSDRSLLHFRCRACRREYRVRFGVPYLLRDYSAVFSPKLDRLGRGETEVDRQIAARLRSLAPDLRARGGRVVLYGVDPATRFTILHLRSDGFEPVAVAGTDGRYVGRDVVGVPVVAVADLGRYEPPVLLSGYPGDGDPAEAVRQAGHRGPVYSLRG